MDILDQLFLRNATEPLQSILFYLDCKTIHDVRTVSKKWNKIISELVWDSKKGREFFKRQRILNWTKNVPTVTACDFYDEMFVYKSRGWDSVANSFDIDEKILVCGLSHVGEGGAKVIDVESRTIITHLDHQKTSSGQRIKKLAVTDVVLTKNWIVTATEERVFAWSRDNYELVKDFVIIPIERMWHDDFSATESKKHLFIACKTVEHKFITNKVFRISPTDTDSPPNHSTIENLDPQKRVILSNGVLVTYDKTNNGHTAGNNIKVTLTIYNLEVSGLEMLKLASNQVLNTYCPLPICPMYNVPHPHNLRGIQENGDIETIIQENRNRKIETVLARDGISYPYFVKVHGLPEQNLTCQREEKGCSSVSVWNIQTGELVKKLHFNPGKDGKPRGVMLRNDILVIRLKDYDNKVKFNIYSINQRDSDSSSHSPSFNVIHRGKEEVNNYHLFRINDFSIIENIDDSFTFTDFC